MENKFYKCKCNSGSFNGNCPVCEPKEEWICKECGHHKLSKVYCDHYCHIKKVEPKEEPKDVWAEFYKLWGIESTNREITAPEITNFIKTHFISRAELGKELIILQSANRNEMHNDRMYDIGYNQCLEEIKNLNKARRF